MFQNNDSSYTIQLCTKIGTDAAGQQALQELYVTGVDVSSPLFCVVEEATTNIVHVIVDSSDSKTRTCIFTPGTCGDLH